MRREVVVVLTRLENWRWDAVCSARCLELTKGTVGEGQILGGLSVWGAGGGASGAAKVRGAVHQNLDCRIRMFLLRTLPSPLLHTRREPIFSPNTERNRTRRAVTFAVYIR